MAGVEGKTERLGRRRKPFEGRSDQRCAVGVKIEGQRRALASGTHLGNRAHKHVDHLLVTKLSGDRNELRLQEHQTQRVLVHLHRRRPTIDIGKTAFAKTLFRNQRLYAFDGVIAIGAVPNTSEDLPH
jgi:hypothetical protein